MMISSKLSRLLAPQSQAPVQSQAEAPQSKTSLAYYPALLRETEKLRDLRQWDHDSAALLKMAAGKLHSEQQSLSPHWDNDRMLAELDAYDWKSGGQGAPSYLQQFAQKVIQEVEQHPQAYLAAFPCAAETAPLEPRPGLAVAGMLSDMAGKVIHKVLEKLIIEAIPLPQLRAFKDSYEELSGICKGNYSPQRKLEELATALDRLGRQLASGKGLGAQEGRKLKAYLDAVGPWLKSASGQWAALEHSLLELKDQPSVLGKTLELTAAAEKLLADPQLKRALDGDRLDGIAQSLGAMRQTLGQVRLWQALPQEAGLGDYLDILTDNPLLEQQLAPSLLRLGKALAQTQKTVPYPVNGSLAERLGWLAETLARPELRESLQPHLEMLLGGPAQAEQLLAAFQFADQLGRSPADSGLGGQALWLLSALGQTSVESPAWSWTRQFQSALGADADTVVLLNRLLTLNRSPESWAVLMRDLGKAAAPSLGLWAGAHLAERWLPAHAAQELEKFYRESSASESWGGMFQRMAGSFVAVAKPYLVEKLMGDPLAAATVQYAEALQNHSSWEQTLQWFVAHDQSQNQTLQFAYSQYLNARLAYQVCLAFNSQDPVETEDRLRLLARQLKDCQVVRHYPQLEKLVDLIPLLPALREAGQTVGAQPVADSWLAWGNQWLDALADSKSESVRNLREQLSRRMENWLADAVMSACDALVQQPWGLLPGAEAASAAQPATAQPAAPSRLAANWQLAGGISLEALGLAAVGYALWRARQDAPAPLPAEIELKEILVHSAPAASQDESSPFQPPMTTSAPAAGGSALWEQKAPLLLGIAAMAAGGALLYGWARRDGAQPNPAKGEALRLAHEIITQLDVDDLHFVFDQPQFAVELEGEEGAPLRRAARSLPSENTDDEEDLPFQIDQVLHNLDMSRAIRTEFNRLFEKADRAGEVRELPPGKERDIRRLLKTIELTSAFIDDIKDKPSLNEFREFGQVILKDLSALADAQTDDLSKSIVERYRQGFAVQSAPPTGAAVPTDAPPSPDQALEQAFQLQSEQSLERVERLYQPILNPASYIDDYIRKGISAFEQRKGSKTQLRPDSKIRVDYFPRVHPNPNLQGPRAPLPASRYFTLTEIVTGQYLYESKRLKDSSGREYRVTGMQHQELVDALTKDNLQSAMERELKAYRDQPDNAAGMKSFYQDMINVRCLEYLSRGHQTPLYAQAVKDFLEGKVQAQAVSFHGTALNGVFMIPAGPAGGVMFSVDDDKFFHIGSSRHDYIDSGRKKSEVLSTFPQNKAFQEWVFSKQPSYQALKYEQDQSAFKYKVIKRVPGGLMFPPSFGVITERPFSFVASQGREQLADQLYNGLMERLESDIDTLVFSYPEQITEAALEVAKKILTIGSIGLAVAIPGTGSVLARLSLFMASLALDAAYVGASAVQAHMSDRPDQAEAFRTEAIIAGVLGGVGAVAGGAPLISQGVKAAYSVKNVNQAIMFYRQAKAVSRRVIPSVLSEMNWGRLADPRKVDLLVNTMQEGAQARGLAQLTNRETVRQSIRNNLLRDFEGQQKTRFAWGDFATEQANVQRRLDSDLARLSDVNGHMRQLLDHPPAVPRQPMPGVPEEAAAGWIAGNSRSAKTAAEAQELKTRIQSALEGHREADLLDIRTMESLHNAVYKPAAGQLPRAFRSSSDPVFMGSDIARSGFEKALIQIEAKSVAGQVDLADALYAAVVRYHPFGDGNGRTARAIYALARLQKGEGPFMALSKRAEDILNPPGPLGLPRPGPSGVQVPAKAGSGVKAAERALSPAPVKPKLKDFADKAEFDEAMKKYLVEKGTLQRMETAGSSFDDLASRRRKAAGQLEQFQGSRPDLFEKLRTDPSANFTLTSIDGDPAETLVLSAHGWYTRDSRNALLPAGKDLVFLGPHGQVLLEPPSSAAFLPTQKLLDGAEYPAIYARLRNRAGVGGKDYSAFTEVNAGVAKDNWVKNYHIKHYEKMPEEEARLAVLNNRASGSQSKMDLLTVSDMAGNKKTLKDVLEEMKPGGRYSHYKQLVFAACREEKTPGTLLSLKTGLGEGYEVKFAKTPLQRQDVPRQRRNAETAPQDGDETPFDGYWVYEAVTLTPNGDGVRIQREIREILPYVLTRRPAPANSPAPKRVATLTRDDIIKFRERQRLAGVTGKP
ncbi:Fic family protein [Chromobacterium alkanivorans]|uniref:putative adhesin n=1 Tax=Chromobacterium alkanivorans TaxID=1071719 RepID=UPI001967A98E|nr:Fic family protein [Chromobacterium alkanivorans]MBN3005347.1 Fic family protein [Chromobacterium alkanivorans]